MHFKKVKHKVQLPSPPQSFSYSLYYSSGYCTLSSHWFQHVLWMTFVCLYCFACYRHSLFGGSSVKMIDTDLSRLYTATSLMQIDDNIMRYVEKQISESHSSQCCFDVVDCWSVFLNLLICTFTWHLRWRSAVCQWWELWNICDVFDISCFFFFFGFLQKIPRPQLSQRVLWEGELCTLYSQCKICFCVHLTSSHLMFLFLVCLCICFMYGFLFAGKGATAASELRRWSSGSWLTAHHPSHTSR